MIKQYESGGLILLKADGIRAEHAFTTRPGGVSKGHLASLNLSFGRGDDPENVFENYRRLGEAVGFDTHCAVLSKQTHSDIVYRAEEQDWGSGLYRPALPPCDALITDVPGTALMVFTADCTPILLHDPVTGAVGAVHAGWRGTAMALAAKTAAAMCDAYGCRPEDLRAAIGPNIGPCHFETDADVPDAMYAAFGDGIAPYIRRAGEKYFVDLKGINAHTLRQAGVTGLDISTDCTACRGDLLWSHRATKGRWGSQGAVIICGKERL